MEDPEASSERERVVRQVKTGGFVTEGAGAVPKDRLDTPEAPPCFSSALRVFTPLCLPALFVDAFPESRLERTISKGEPQSAAKFHSF